MYRFYRLLFMIVGVFAVQGLPLYSDQDGCYAPDCNTSCDQNCVEDLSASGSFWKSCFCNNSYFYFGGVGYGVKLKTDDSGIGVDSFYGSGDDHDCVNGSQWGIVAGITMRNCCCKYFNSEFEWATGNVSAGEECIDSLPNRRLDQYLWTSRVGYNFFCQDTIFTPFGGIGYRYADHDLSDSNLSLNYRDWFGILGARIDRPFCGDWCIGLNGEIYIPFSSSVKLSEYCDRVDTDCQIGYQLELPITRTFCICSRTVTLSFAPFYREFVNGESDEVTFDIETIKVPELETQNYGAKLYVLFCF